MLPVHLSNEGRKEPLLKTQMTAGYLSDDGLVNILLR